MDVFEKKIFFENTRRTGRSLNPEALRHQRHNRGPRGPHSLQTRVLSRPASNYMQIQRERLKRALADRRFNLRTKNTLITTADVGKSTRSNRVFFMDILCLCTPSVIVFTWIFRVKQYKLLKRRRSLS